MIDRISELMTVYPHWAGAIFGIIAFGESVAILGTVIPATPILFLVGTLIGSGRQDAWTIVPPAILGSIAGYWLSWAIGRRLGPAVYRLRPLRHRRRAMARVRLFFRRWGGPSLIVGRYVLGPLQSMLPMVAGAAKMDAHRFHLWSTLSGVVWVPTVLIPGYIAGRGLVGLAGEGMQRTILAGSFVVSAALVVAALVATVVPMMRRRRA